VATSVGDRRLYKEMYWFSYDENLRGPAVIGACACTKTKSTGQPCRRDPIQYVGSLLVCDSHIGWAKMILKKLKRDF